MSITLSLQGCMAVGKTTALRYLEENVPEVHISCESTARVIAEVRRRGLNKNQYADYLEIQRLWIENEIERWELARNWPCTVMDFGAEEIEFYTLHYPQSIGCDWAVEAPLADALARLRACMPDRILFLDASAETLRRRKAGDAARSRTFFEHHLNHFMPQKRKWFAEKPNTDFLCTDGMTPLQLGQSVRTWVDACRFGQNL